ncbi:hypothetical protein PT286_04500 [Neisseriaceae bacterium ESL0693]|nr:hypothetical protein [Neisseriaceae bacterium ESL0693]
MIGDLIIMIVASIFFIGFGFLIGCMISDIISNGPVWWIIITTTCISILLSVGMFASYFDEHKNNDSLTTTVKKLPDGRKVTCLKSDTSLSCDWGNVEKSKQNNDYQKKGSREDKR